MMTTLASTSKPGSAHNGFCLSKCTTAGHKSAAPPTKSDKLKYHWSQSRSFTNKRGHRNN